MTKKTETYQHVHQENKDQQEEIVSFKPFNNIPPTTNIVADQDEPVVPHLNLPAAPTIANLIKNKTNRITTSNTNNSRIKFGEIPLIESHKMPIKNKMNVHLEKRLKRF